MRTVLILVCGLLHFALNVLAQPAQLLLQGRFGGDVNEATGLGVAPVLFSWPAGSVYTSFNGSGVNATLSALPPSPTYDAYSRFVFYVDGAQVGTATTTPNATVAHWSVRDLSAGNTQLLAMPVQCIAATCLTSTTEATFGQAVKEQPFGLNSQP